MSSSHKKIILIEDELGIAELYKTVFEGDGFEVENILTGSEAEEKINEINKGETEKPDLILLDLILPDISGLELLKKLRNVEKTRDIPVVVLSNYSGEDTKKECEDLGIDGYILKIEVTPQELVEIIKKKFQWEEN